MKIQYRLGLDLGANSIGWCALELDPAGSPSGLLDMGARVYPDGRDPQRFTSLAAERRGPRAMRRNRDRYLRRRKNLLNALTRYGLMPFDEDERKQTATLDPYALRAMALHERLRPNELGRILFHLNQHRGFKSNRKTDRVSNEGGLISDATARTTAELARTGHLTIGSWLAERHKKHQPVRVRLAGSGKTEAYPFYPLRSMIEAEFDLIWTAQAGWNPALTDTMRDQLRTIIFFQRELKPAKVGKCWLEPTEFRAPRALPTTQRYRIAQTLSHLRLTRPGMPEEHLSDSQRSILATQLYRGRDLPFDRVRKLLGVGSETDFNTRENKLVGCSTAARLGHGKKAPIGEGWFSLNLEVQDGVVTALLDAETDEQAIDGLLALGIEFEAAHRVVGTTLVDGHGTLSTLAMGKILPHLEAGMSYDQAVQAAGFAHHSDRRTGEILERLPYYGQILHDRIGTGTGEPTDIEEKRFGKAPNPTVHVALNELRRVVNAIFERYGPPKEIVVETLREMGRTKKQREAYRDEQKKNESANDERKKSLLEMGLPVNGRNLMRLRLWQEQATDPKNRVCPYSGTVITARTALSDQVEEDHILPFAVTLDDSAANRLLVTREKNRIKARRAPYEAFGHSADWPQILERVALLPPQKRWRFQPDAMNKYAKDGDFLARHLTDSATIARWAKDYLEVLAPGKVWSTPGRLTSLLRDKLGLTSSAVLGRGGARKDRNDHRHHAVDAVVVALTDRSLLQRTTIAAKRAEDTGERLVVKMEPPWEGFHADVARRAATMAVSYKPDIGWQAALHNDTAYGPIRNPGEDRHNVVVRRPIVDFYDMDLTDRDEDDKFKIRDPVLRAKAVSALRSATDAPGRKAALSGLVHSGGHTVRNVRATQRLDSVQPIADRGTGNSYKIMKRDGNHRVELWRLPTGRLRLSVVSTFDAAQQAEAERLGRKPRDLRPHPAAKLLMRLHKGDMLLFGTGENRRLTRVIKMREGQVTLAPHNEGGDLKKRDSDKQDPFKYINASATSLEAARARKVFVTPDGRIWNGDRRP